MTRSFKLAVVAMLVASSSVVAKPAKVDPMTEKKKAENLNRVYTLMESGDSFQAMEFIETQGTPHEVANTYFHLVFGLYYKKHDVARMLFIGRAGIQYCLAQAQSAEKQELADKLRQSAKGMAYNLSSFTWPGWNESGITVTRSDMMAGLDAARLNLRLAQELKRGPGALGGAHWMLGAQHLAFGDSQLALDEFARAVEHFRQASKDDSEQMARGYIGIAKLTVERSGAEGKAKVAAAIGALNEMDTEDAKFYAQQLESVAEFFQNR